MVEEEVRAAQQREDEAKLKARRIEEEAKAAKIEAEEKLIDQRAGFLGVLSAIPSGLFGLITSFGYLISSDRSPKFSYSIIASTIAVLAFYIPFKCRHQIGNRLISLSLLPKKLFTYFQFKPIFLSQLKISYTGLIAYSLFKVYFFILEEIQHSEYSWLFGFIFENIPYYTDVPRYLISFLIISTAQIIVMFRAVKHLFTTESRGRIWNLSASWIFSFFVVSISQFDGDFGAFYVGFRSTDIVAYLLLVFIHMI